MHGTQASNNRDKWADKMIVSNASYNSCVMKFCSSVTVLMFRLQLCLLLQSQQITHTHTHPFNGPLSGTTQVSRYQKGKTNLDFTEERDSEWQWHQLGHMQVSTSLQTDNHASTPPLSFYRLDALPATQPTVSKHWRLLSEQITTKQKPA